ncbi:MAG: acyl carrier protein [Eubacteriales bacterium]|nr:acyl carrier protein [Eubacteriales bacterium]
MVLEKLQQIIAAVLHVDVREVSEQTSFARDLGADSLDLLQIVSMAEEEFHIRFAGEDLRTLKTVGDAVAMIDRLQR